MARLRYTIRPLDGGFSSEWSSLHAPAGTIVYPSKNIRIEKHRAIKRWGTDTDRTVGDTSTSVLAIAIYQLKDTTRNTMYLTGADLCLKETDTGNTFSYKTETYTTGNVTNITGAVVTGDTDCTWVAGMVGDKFITDTNHSSQVEPDTNWATIASFQSATQITLSDTYSGTTGAGTWTYKIRQVYTTPSNELPWYAIVDDKFCFGNGNIDVQVYGDTTYAYALDSTNAKKARYGIEYANRLVLADLEVSSTRDQMTIQWSAEGNPTQWGSGTYPTAGSLQLLQSSGYITGLGKVGQDLVVYKSDSIHIGYRTGIATAPIAIPAHRIGEGMIAPASLIQAFYTNFFLGETDFYRFVGDYPVSIGESIRDFFFDNVTRANAEKTIGFPVETKHELHWIATTTDYGQLDFVYNLRSGKWYVYAFADTITGAGKGAL